MNIDNDDKIKNKYIMGAWKYHTYIECWTLSNNFRMWIIISHVRLWVISVPEIPTKDYTCIINNNDNI